MMLHLCAADGWGLPDNVPNRGSSCSTALPTPKRPCAALQVFGTTVASVLHEGAAQKFGTFLSATRSGAFPPLPASMQHSDPYTSEVWAALQVVGGRFHSVTREGAFQGTRVAILAGFNAASGLQRPDVASSRRLARLQPRGLDLQYAPNMLAQVGAAMPGCPR